MQNVTAALLIFCSSHMRVSTQAAFLLRAATADPLSNHAIINNDDDGMISLYPRSEREGGKWEE